MCGLRMPPWDGKQPLDAVQAHGSPLSPWLVGLCEWAANGGPPVLLPLLLRMLTEARAAAEEARRSGRPHRERGGASPAALRMSAQAAATDLRGAGGGRGVEGEGGDRGGNGAPSRESRAERSADGGAAPAASRLRFPDSISGAGSDGGCISGTGPEGRPIPGTGPEEFRSISGTGPEGRSISGAGSEGYREELRVQRVVLKALLILARNAPSASVFAQAAVAETLFGLALTQDAEVRLMAVHVLRELAESDPDATRYLCSPEALQGVLALCARAASTHPAGQGMLAALELLETLLSTLTPPSPASLPPADSRPAVSLPAGLGDVLAAVEAHAPVGSASHTLARGMRAHFGLPSSRPSARPPRSTSPGRRASIGASLGGLLNRAFPGGGGSGKRA